MLDLTDLRSVRSFIAGTWDGGGSDQSYTTQDALAVNKSRQYQSIGPNGLVGQEGASVSNAQMSSRLLGSMPLLALLGVAAAGYFLLRKGR